MINLSLIRSPNRTPIRSPTQIQLLSLSLSLSRIQRQLQSLNHSPSRSHSQIQPPSQSLTTRPLTHALARPE